MSDPPASRPTGRQRNRRMLVCRSCRTKKIKCDRTDPCGACQKTGTECSFASHGLLTTQSVAGSSTPPASTAQFQLPKFTSLRSNDAQHNNNISSVEQVSSQASLQRHNNLSTAAQPRSYNPLPHQSRYSSYTTVSESSGPIYIGRSTDNSTGSNISLHGTFSKTRLFGQSHWMHSFGRFESIVTLKDNPILNSNSFRNEGNRNEIVALIRKCKAIAKSTKLELHNEWLAVKDIQALVPSRQICDILIELYFRTGESLYRVLHIPTFRREYEQYWENPASVSTSFVLKMLLAMSNGVIFLRAPASDPIFSQAKKWIFAGQHWLAHAPTEKSRLTVAGLQVHCLLILARQAHGVVGDLAWISVGALLRAARMMGMDRNPEVIPKMTTMHAEMRRRLWATIIELNLQLSLDMGKQPGMSMDDFDTSAPANFDDTDIHESMEESSRGKPDETLTQSTLQILLFKSFGLRLEACQLINSYRGSRSYDKVIELGAQLTRHAQTLNNIPNIPQLQRNLYDFHVRRFMFLLHSIYGTKALNDPHYYYSRKICRDSARLMGTYAHEKFAFSDSSVHEQPVDDFTLLQIRSQDFLKKVMIHSYMTLFHEVFQQIEDDTNESFTTKQERREGREPLKRILRDAIKLCEQRIEFGANNVKGHLFLSAIYAQMEGAEDNTDSNTAAVQGAINSARICMSHLDTILLRVRGAEDGISTEHLGLNMLTPPNTETFDGLGLEDFNMAEDFDVGSWGLNDWVNDDIM